MKRDRHEWCSTTSQAASWSLAKLWECLRELLKRDRPTSG